MNFQKEASYDLLVVIPLEEEYLEFQKVFPHKQDLTNDGCFMAEVETGSDEISALVIIQEEMGKSAASSAVDEALSRFTISVVVCLGIAGAISKDLRLCDVCYSGNILDVFDNSKASDGEGGMNIALSPTHYKSPKAISNSIDYVRRLPGLQARYSQWQRQGLELLQEHITTAIPGRNKKEETLGSPKSLKGTIACGVVSASDTYNQQLVSLDRKVLAIETESGGVFARAEFHCIPAVCIRGISDYADHSKGELEGETAGLIRMIAAQNAASFLRLQIENPRFREKIKPNEKPFDESQPEANGDEVDSVPKLVEKISAKIESRLGDLSPEHKLLPKGFVLPLPRIRPITEGKESSSEASLTEILRSIEHHDKVYLSLGPSYPERSLAWLIADEVIQSEIDGQQLLPIVVDGEQVKPPNYGLEYAASDEIGAINGSMPVQPVIIFDGVPLSSQTRMNFLIEQINQHPKAKFIFVDRSASNLFFEGEFETSLAAKPFEVCDISFSQMSHFVQKNFEMNSSEADVIALRLRDTFQKFDLSAHPSYFAGIPRSTLAALIQANRRAELMDLAVVGFMSFVVAGDQSDIQLSRSTRTRFLQQLLIQIWVEKRQFDETELTAFVTTFSKEFDFDIKPITFIKGFLDSGILHFDSGRVRVSLPFIEHYLLASALAADSKLANRYFDVTVDSFDYATFDLYAEIGPSQELVDRVLDELELAIEIIRDEDDYPNEPVLWSSDVEDLLEISQIRITSLQKRIGDAIQAVSKGTVDTEEKQQMLDASDRVGRSVASERSRVRSSALQEAEPFSDVGHLANMWTVGTYLLGSGAEHLDASRKRRLAGLATKGAETIINDWTQFHLSLDFSELRIDLTSDENIQDFISKSPSDRSPDEVKQLFLDLFHAIQHMTLAMPFHKVLGFLCEHARGAVLAQSVEQSGTKTDFEAVLKAIWLTDISVSKGKEEISNGLRLLPRSTFFRFCVATHFLTRVYWNHARKSDRLAMLDYSDAVLKPTNLKIGKSELRRMIERESKQKEAAKKDSDTT